MSLGITVGRLARWLQEGDQECAALARQDLREISIVLKLNHVRLHFEPEWLPKLRRRSRLDHMPYSWYALL